MNSRSQMKTSVTIAAAIAGAAIILSSTGAGAATITVKNNCSYQIGVGVYPPAAYSNGGWFQAAGTSVTFNSWTAGVGGRIWSRHNCRANGSGPDICDSGTCGGSGIACAGSTAAGVSEAEINFNASGVDWYDVSYVDGLNDPTTIATSTGISYGCSSKPACTTVTNDGYGGFYSGTGDSCQSPCNAAKQNIAPYNADPSLYCCSGSHATSATCQVSTWNSGGQGWVNNIHSKCPSEYSYAYDDNIGLHQIATGVSYTVTFCGGAGATSGSTSSSSTSSSSTSSTSGGINGLRTLTPQNATGSRLDDYGGGTGNGNKIEIYHATGGNAQAWNISNAGVTPAGNYTLAVNLGSYCLQAHSSTNGSLAELWACNGSTNQSWNIVADSSPAGYYQLHPAVAGSTCLDIVAGSSADGAQVDIWTCSGQTNQQWLIR